MNIALWTSSKIRDIFEKHNIKKILAADKTNIKFHDLPDKIFVPTGFKELVQWQKYLPVMDVHYL